MSRRAKARLAMRKASRRLARAYRLLSAYKPSPLVVALAAVAVAIFLFGGGVYDVVVKPVVAVPRPRSIWVAYPYTLLEQWLMESIISMVSFAMGFAGLFLIYESTKYADDPHRAYYRFIVGVLLLLAAYFMGQYMLRVQKLKTVRLGG